MLRVSDPDLCKTIDASMSLGDHKVNLEILHQNARQQEMGNISRYAVRLGLEIERHKQSNNWADQMKQILQDYQKADDILGLASCMIMVGDNIALGPATSSLTLNMVLVGPLLPADYDSDWPSVSTELDRQFCEVQQDRRHEGLCCSGQSYMHETSKPISEDRAKGAVAWYSRALQLYSEAGVKRGIVHVKLRIHTIIHMLALHPGYVLHHFETYNELLKNNLAEGAALLEAAADPVLERVYKFHQGAWEVRYDSFHLRPGDDGWAMTNGTISTMRLLGVLVCRLGHHYRYLCGSYRYATRCYEFASLIYQNIPPLQISRFNFYATRINMEISFGLLREARAHLEDMRLGLTPLHGLIDQGVTRYPHIAARCKNIRWHTSRKMLQCATLIYSKTGNATFMSPDNVHLITQHLSQYASTDAQRDLSKVELGTVDFCKSEEELLLEIGRLSMTNIEQVFLSCFPNLQGKGYTREALLRLLDICIRFGLADQLAMLSDGALTSVTTTYSRIGDRDLNQFIEAASIPKFLSHAWHLAVQCSESCLEFSIRGRKWRTAEEWADRLELLCPGYFTSIHCPSATWRWQRCLWLGLIKEHHGHDDEALHLFMRALSDTESDVPTNNNLEEVRSRHYLSDRGRIADSIVRLYLRLGKTKTEIPVVLDGERVSSDNAAVLALLTLEEKKSRYLREQLCFRDAVTEGKDIEKWLIADRDMKLWLELHSLGVGRDGEEEEEYRVLSSRRPQFHMDIRTNYQPVLSVWNSKESNRKSLPELRSCLNPAIIVVYMSLTEDGFLLFCLGKEGFNHAASYEDVSPAYVSRKVGEYLSLMNGQRNAANTKILHEISRDSSDVIIKPISHILPNFAWIVFVPSSDLSRYPLGTLLLNESSIGLTWNVSVDRTTSIARLGTITEELRPGGEVRLPMGGIEALMVADMWNSTPMDASKLTRESFRKALSNSVIVHVGTHGYAKQGSSQRLYISMGERVRVMDLIGLRSKAKLVVFSTCLSGTGWSFSSDDVDGFAHTVLCSGAQLFAGCLWKANDLTTLLHMTLFYSGFRLVTIAQGNTFLFIELWTWATWMLAGLDVLRARAFLHQLVRNWDSLEKRGKHPNYFVKRGKAKLLDAVKTLTTDDGEALIDFSHPYVWAPFAVVGYGAVCIDLHRDDAILARLKSHMSSEVHASKRGEHHHIDLRQIGMEELLTAMTLFEEATNRDSSQG
ncbi:hypothetical protein MMC25_000805 [Agyrium rufum]|nr:hypothetical protein [Agyrium rufum]